MTKNQKDLLDTIYQFLDVHGASNMADALEIIVDGLRWENEDLKKEVETLNDIIDNLRGHIYN